ncbi:thermonuclease family protein [Neobacillus cucumis]|uniref:thermonuclease family protein n=1 Tax=Neobacillus cucumis TaxID=1740721 RepID=UPI0028530355|nr:thermonuclease family protein [Neobacillus cucumis]MDR4947239.1 thermonuclease family protein [Neobacillus cucumis]
MRKLILVMSLFVLMGTSACGSAGKDQSSEKTTPQKKKTAKTKPETTDAGNTAGNAKEKPKQETKPTPKPVTPAPAPKLETPSNQVAVRLISVTDGDTIKVNQNGKIVTVRYLLFDSSEEHKPNTCVELFSREAAQRNEALLRSGMITLEFEEKNKVDKYGRELAYVFVNGQSVEGTLLKEGYGRVAYIYYPPYKYLSSFQADEAVAKSQKLRIWSVPGFVTSNGFNTRMCVNKSASSTTPSTSKPATPPPPTTSTRSGATEYFANCTELRKKYPNGVPKGHPAYQAKMDRDKDGYACEK